MENTMTTLLTSIGEFGTQAIAWMGDVFDVVVTTPALLILVVGIPVFGIAISYLNRLFRLN